MEVAHTFLRPLSPRPGCSFHAGPLPRWLTKVAFPLLPVGSRCTSSTKQLYRKASQRSRTPVLTKTAHRLDQDVPHRLFQLLTSPRRALHYWIPEQCGLSLTPLHPLPSHASPSACHAPPRTHQPLVKSTGRLDVLPLALLNTTKARTTPTKAAVTLAASTSSTRATSSRCQNKLATDSQKPIPPAPMPREMPLPFRPTRTLTSPKSPQPPTAGAEASRVRLRV